MLINRCQEFGHFQTDRQGIVDGGVTVVGDVFDLFDTCYSYIEFASGTSKLSHGFHKLKLVIPPIETGKISCTMDKRTQCLHLFCKSILVFYLRPRLAIDFYDTRTTDPSCWSRIVSVQFC